MTTPLLCVFLAFLLIWFPRALVIVAIARSGERLDNNHPRDQQARLEGWGKRAQAAHNNAFESFAPFAAAVLVAHLAGANPGHAAALAVTHVVARTVYPLVYIANLGLLRTAVWSIGTLATGGLFVLGYFKLGYFLSGCTRARSGALVTIWRNEVPTMHAISSTITKNTAAPTANRAPGPRPLRVIVYGVEGVGKSTFASQAPNPIFLCSEDGAVHLDVARFPTARTWVEVLEAIRVLTHEEHDYQTLVIDSLDWLEPLCHEHVCKLAGVNHVDEIAYGKGYAEVVQQWRNLLGSLEMLLRSRRMSVILVGHAAARHVETTNGKHDRYQLKVYERVADLLRGWCDALLFARKERVQIERPVTPRTPPEARLLHTQADGPWEASNRHRLPAVLPFDWGEFAGAVRAFRPTSAAAIRAELVALIPYLQESARAAQVMRDWAGEDPAKLYQLLDRVRSKLTLEAAGVEG
jgi:uncharacterized MAPEG superfamily protein